MPAVPSVSGRFASRKGANWEGQGRGHERQGGCRHSATTRSIITILNRWRADDRIAFDAEHGFITLRDVGGLRALTQ
jgi:hypothetical protein